MIKRGKLGRGSGLRIKDVFWPTLLYNVSFTTDDKNLLEGTDTGLSTDGLTEAEAAFMDQVDTDGKPLGIMPAILLVPRRGAVDEQVRFEGRIADRSGDLQSRRFTGPCNDDRGSEGRIEDAPRRHRPIIPAAQHQEGQGAAKGAIESPPSPNRPTTAAAAQCRASTVPSTTSIVIWPAIKRACPGWPIGITVARLASRPRLRRTPKPMSIS